MKHNFFHYKYDLTASDEKVYTCNQCGLKITESGLKRWSNKKC